MAAKCPWCHFFHFHNLANLDMRSMNFCVQLLCVVAGGPLGFGTTITGGSDGGSGVSTTDGGSVTGVSTIGGSGVGTTGGGAVGGAPFGLAGTLVNLL